MKSSFILLILGKNCDDHLGLLGISVLEELKYILLYSEHCIYTKECEPTTQEHEDTVA